MLRPALDRSINSALESLPAVGAQFNFLAFGVSRSRHSQTIARRGWIRTQPRLSLSWSALTKPGANVMTDETPRDVHIFKTIVSDGTSFFPMDTIEYQGKLWLVPKWYESPTEGWRMPERIICLSNLAHRDLRGMDQSADFGMNVPIPKFVLWGPIPEKPTGGYTVVARPPLRIRKLTIH